MIYHEPKRRGDIWAAVSEHPNYISATIYRQIEPRKGKATVGSMLFIGELTASDLETIKINREALVKWVSQKQYTKRKQHRPHRPLPIKLEWSLWDTLKTHLKNLTS